MGCRQLPFYCLVVSASIVGFVLLIVPLHNAVKHQVKSNIPEPAGGFPSELATGVAPNDRKPFPPGQQVRLEPKASDAEQNPSESSVQQGPLVEKIQTTDDRRKVEKYLQTFKSVFILNKNVTSRHSSCLVQTSNKVQSSGQILRSVSRTEAMKEKKKTIVWFGDAFAQDRLINEGFEVCPVSNCEMLPSHHLQTADAVLFRGADGRERPPPRSHPEQIYVLYDMEPPLHVAKNFWTDEWNPVFNWTWNYRRDSDIWEPILYLQHAANIPPIESLAAVTARKTRAAAWFVSHCGTEGGRDEYVQALREQGIDVDIYGECGNLSCPKSERADCQSLLTKRYYFYLAFENAWCHDYVSEKFFNTFAEGVHVLPIVLGGADYSHFFPHGTYIDVSWFRHPKDMAHYLKTLMADPYRYTHLLWRKAHFIRSCRGFTVAMCELCKRLNNVKAYSKWHENVKTWRWENQCFPPPPIF